MTLPDVDFIVAFLLTPLREGRLIVNDEKQIVMEISTHAPAGGATCTTFHRKYC